MEKSLIKTNQCRSYGISLCDDHTDSHRPLGYQTNKLNTPLFMEGTIETMSTLFPSLEDLESCQYIYLSDQESWDPLDVNFNPPLRYQLVPGFAWLHLKIQVLAKH